MQTRGSSGGSTGVMLEEVVLNENGVKVAYNKSGAPSPCYDSHTLLEVTSYDGSGGSAFFHVFRIVPGADAAKGTLCFKLSRATVGPKSKLILHFGPSGSFIATPLVDLSSGGRGDLTLAPSLPWWKAE